ncbi:hypothetical protein BJV77DRAFT_970784 [Russula vinacea]|nr:hypothetical protein BJV77DRAFT_970784 [Russula vinacea]
MKPREYCCCAIPVINVGIYLTLTEQFVLGIVAGTLSIATPQIVGAATPSFARWIFAAVCYVGAMIQVLGFIGVAKKIQYPACLNHCGCFSLAAVWIGISASRHSTAQSNCEQRFFTAASDLTSEGETICNIFPWVDIGLMGGLWALLVISQFYFYTIVSGYSTGQRGDHEKFNSIYSMTGLNNDFDVPNHVAPGAAGKCSKRYCMFENPFNDPSREEIPAEHLGKPVHNQYDEYRDPYYRGAQGAL